MNVVFIVFNRPECTQKVFRRISAARPEQLLLIADGPRKSVSNDADRVALVRDIISRVDWPCTVHRNFADQNLGCRARVSSGLDWAFSIVEEAIILEDDCLPDMSFFVFCRGMLDRFRHDERVMHIGGGNYQHGIRRTSSSYYFSKYPHVWGWATWRRAWKHYDLEMKQWPELRATGWLKLMCPREREHQFWTGIFDRAYDGKVDTWDYQWNFACWVNKGVSIVPALNLVENIGFGPEATHTMEMSAGIKSVETGALAEILRHPREIIVNKNADLYTFKTLFCPPQSLYIHIHKTFLNRYFYGRYFRKIPILGNLWARWRVKRGQEI